VGAAAAAAECLTVALMDSTLLSSRVLQYFRL